MLSVPDVVNSSLEYLLVSYLFFHILIRRRLARIQHVFQIVHTDKRQPTVQKLTLGRKELTRLSLWLLPLAQEYEVASSSRENCCLRLPLARIVAGIVLYPDGLQYDILQGVELW